MTGLLEAEFTKVRTLPAVWIAFGIALLAGVLLGWLTGAGGSISIAAPGLVSLVPAYTLLAVPVFAAGSEYRGGQLRVSLLAVPARGRLFAAKLLVSTAVTVVAAVVVATPGYLLERGATATAGGLAARILAYSLLGLIGFGLAALTRTVVTPVAVLFTLPVLVSTALGGLLPGLVRLLPHEATLSFLGMPASTQLSTGRLTGLAVAAAWATLLVAAGWFATAKRDS